MNFDEIKTKYQLAMHHLAQLNNPYTPAHQDSLDLRLLTFLQQTPNLYPNSLESYIQDQIEAVVVYKLCNEDPRYFDLLFKNSNGSSDTLCGYIFKKGDGIYCCHDCGLDNTCVMCVTCFKASDHENHDTSFHYSQGTGGCCDCGDAEAWKVPGTCTIHCAKVEDDVQDKKALPKELIDRMRMTIATVLEMIVWVLDYGQLVETVVMENRAKFNEFDGNAIKRYALLLWNDEDHSIQEVIEHLCEIFGFTEDVAKDYVMLIDRLGRGILKVSADVPLLNNLSRKLLRVGLKCTTAPFNDVQREFMMDVLLNLLQTLLSSVAGPQVIDGVVYESAKVCIRNLICEELTEPFLYANSQTQFAKVSEIEKVTRVDYIILQGRNLWKQVKANLKQLLIKTFVADADYYKKWLGTRFALLYLDIALEHYLDDEKYESSMLSVTVQLFTVPSVCNMLLETSDVVADILIFLKANYLQDIYPDNVDLTDESSDSIQFATTFTLSKYPALTCKGRAMTERREMHILSDIGYIVTALNTTSKSYDLFRIGHSTDQEEVSDLFRYLDLLTIFQGMNPQKRAIGIHLEYDSESWVHAFNSSISYLKLCKNIAQSYYYPNSEAHRNKIFFLFSETMDQLFNWSIAEHKEFVDAHGSGGTYTGFHLAGIAGHLKFNVPDRKVYVQPVSLHHALHWFLSFLLMQVPKLLKARTGDFSRFEDQLFGLEDLVSPSGAIMEDSPEYPILERLNRVERELLLFNYPLETLAVVSHINVGLWVRNGESPRFEAKHFKEVYLRGAYDANIFLMQYAIIKLGSNIFLTNILDRFGVLGWFNLENEESPFDHVQTSAVVEDVFNLLIALLTERAFLNGNSATQILRKEIIHQLAVNPSGLAYSTLSKIVTFIDFDDAQRDPDYQSFDNILFSVSNFKYPDGIVDHGVYTLKEEFYDEVYPWYWHYTKNQREEAETILKQKFSNNPSLPPERSLNLPKIDNIPGNFGFEKIDEIVHGAVFGHTLVVAFWKVCKPVFDIGNQVVSESLFSHLLELLLISVEISKKGLPREPNFVSYAEQIKLMASVVGNAEIRRTSLLDIVLALVDKANVVVIKDYRSQLRYVVGQFEALGGELVVNVIKGWRDKSNWNFFGEDFKAIPDNGLDAAEKKKMAAKARQAAIMAQFSKARESFMANYGDEMDDMDVDDSKDEEDELIPLQEFPDKKQVPFCDGICIVCTEDVSSSSKSFGLLGLIQHSAIRRQVDLEDPSNLTKVLQTPLTLDEIVDRKLVENVTNENIGQVTDDNHFFINKTENDLNGSRLANLGVVAVTCGHLMHSSCLDTYMLSIQTRQNSQFFRNHPENLRKQEFLCPLCKSLSNVLMPVLWDHKEFKINWNGSLEGEIPSLSLPEYMRQSLEPFNSRVLSNDDAAESMAMSGADLDGTLGESSQSRLAKETSYCNQLVLSMAAFKQFVSELTGREIVVSQKPVYEKYLFRSLVDLYEMTQSDQSGVNDLRLSENVPIFNAMTNTIASIEIMTRGMDSLINSSDNGYQVLKVGLFDRLNSQNQILLRVLSETCLSSLVLKGIYSVELPLKEFVSALSPLSEAPTSVKVESSLMYHDGFSHLVLASMAIIPQLDQSEDHFSHWTEFFGIFEIVRTVISMLEGFAIYGTSWVERLPSSVEEIDFNSADSEPMTYLTKFLLTQLDSIADFDQFSKDHIALITKFCKYSLLIYCRRAAILLYARFGVVPPGGALGFGDCSRGTLVDEPKNELDRLLLYLGMSSFSSLLSKFTETYYESLVKHWCKGMLNHDDSYWKGLLGPKSKGPGKWAYVTLDQPNLFELIRLPRKLDTLFDIALKTKCGRCNQVPPDPALCLLCGQFVCIQSFCCMDEQRGECNMHRDDCGINIGIYMSVKRCSILLLNSGNGTFSNPPYLDTHGEVDPGLRRGKRQFLNQKRFDELRRLWLTHGIPSMIARKLEQTIDNGGWITM